MQLVQRFCSSSLPFNCCHLSIEDFVYLHDSVRLNLVCFVADLFALLELQPFKASVAAHLPGVERAKVIEVPDPGKEQPLQSSLVQCAVETACRVTPRQKKSEKRISFLWNEFVPIGNGPIIYRASQIKE